MFFIYFISIFDNIKIRGCRTILNSNTVELLHCDYDVVYETIVIIVCITC